jgi:hypothetical protein
MKPHFALRQAKVAFVAANLDQPREALPALLRNAGLYSPATKDADILSGLPRLIAQAQASPAERGQKKTAQCLHDNWAVRQYDRLGFGRCLDCHREVPLSELFNNLRRRAAELRAPHRAEHVFVKRDSVGSPVLVIQPATPTPARRESKMV